MQIFEALIRNPHLTTFCLENNEIISSFSLSNCFHSSNSIAKKRLVRADSNRLIASQLGSAETKKAGTLKTGSGQLVCTRLNHSISCLFRVCNANYCRGNLSIQEKRLRRRAGRGLGPAQRLDSRTCKK